MRWPVLGRLVRWWLRIALVLGLTLSVSLPLVWGDWFILSTSGKTHDAFPESLDDLVPQYLPAEPVDPFDPSEGLLQYRRTDDGYLLYSVGGNGIDEGGTAPDEEDLGGFNTGDLRLDIFYAQDPESAAEDAPEDEEM